MIITKNGISYLTFSLFEKAGIRAAVSCREGGVSAPPFDSLDMGFHTGDDPEAVRENRKRFLEALQIAPESMVSCVQVHGVHIEEVTEKDRGRGAFSYETAIPDTDGLVTEAKNTALTMLYADCTPLIFADPVRKVIAVSHGGWRGTAGNIAGKTVDRMVEQYGCQRENILCAVGPALCRTHFEVGGEVIEKMRELFGEDTDRLTVPGPAGKYLFDLPGANEISLLQAGIPKEHIENSGICTWEDEHFYSYRKEHGRTGRHMAVIVL